MKNKRIVAKNFRLKSVKKMYKDRTGGFDGKRTKVGKTGKIYNRVYTQHFGRVKKSWVLSHTERIYEDELHRKFGILDIPPVDGYSIDQWKSESSSKSTMWIIVPNKQTPFPRANSKVLVDLSKYSVGSIVVTVSGYISRPHKTVIATFWGHSETRDS